jgi:hypothetical protein
VSRYCSTFSPRTRRARSKTIKLQHKRSECLCRKVEVLKADDIEPLFAKMAEDGTDGVLRPPGSARSIGGRKLGRQPSNIACQ